jgi:hypothetical protein
MHQRIRCAHCGSWIGAHHEVFQHVRCLSEALPQREQWRETRRQAKRLASLAGALGLSPKRITHLNNVTFPHQRCRRGNPPRIPPYTVRHDHDVLWRRSTCPSPEKVIVVPDSITLSYRAHQTLSRKCFDLQDKPFKSV